VIKESKPSGSKEYTAAIYDKKSSQPPSKSRYSAFSFLDIFDKKTS
jgi:hypothetical protein